MRVSLYQLVMLLLLVVVGLLDLCVAHVHGSGCNHHHHHEHDHHKHQQQQFSPMRAQGDRDEGRRLKLPEELAEEEDLRLYGFQSFSEVNHHHDHGPIIEDFSELMGVGLWINALGCSLLVSMASLICLIFLPLIFAKGKPSKAAVDALALFGAGAMLGDAFLHQLPHAFGGEQSHNHNVVELGHDHGHSHSLKDLSVGLSVLGGILLFLLVEKIVRYVDYNTGGDSSSAHSHHHHHHHHSKKSNPQIDNFKDENSNHPSGTVDKINQSTSNLSSEEVLDDEAYVEVKKQPENVLRKRKTSGDGDELIESEKILKANSEEAAGKKEAKPQAPSNMVFGYLNLFSDGVHNFTDGVALGSAFLLYGSVGGWSRTLFLLAHELPQEIGDFGILVRSGFSVSKALFFNFLSALVALVGTALSLLGQDPGQSSFIEAFTAGGFIYIAVAGVLAEMNNSSSSSIKTTIAHLTFLVMGMGVALCISLV